jgi:hypothetical protein
MLVRQLDQQQPEMLEVPVLRPVERQQQEMRPIHHHHLQDLNQPRLQVR